MKHSYNLRRISYQESCGKLLGVERWLNSKGIITENTRFKKILENVSKLYEAHKSQALDSLIQERGNKELWFSLLEASPFELIYETFSNLRRYEISPPKEKLKSIIDGPFLPEEEEKGSGNVNNRNYLFELELAAKLRNRGIKILGFADVKIEFESVNFFIECKRLFSDKNIKSNIERAYEQLKKQMSEKDRGIIALSIEKIYKTDHLIFEATEAETEDRVNQIIDTFIRENEEYWQRIIDIRVVGVFVVLKFIVIIRPKILLTSGFQLAIRPLCSPVNLQYSDYDRLIALGNKLISNDNNF